MYNVANEVAEEITNTQQLTMMSTIKLLSEIVFVKPIPKYNQEVVEIPENMILKMLSRIWAEMVVGKD